MSWSITTFDGRDKFIPHARVYCFAVNFDGDVVGMLSIEEIGGYAWINDLFVEPQYRRRGIGEALLHAAVGLAGTAFPDTDCIGAGVSALNAPSMKLFEKLGFTRGDIYTAQSHLMTRSHIEVPEAVCS